MRIAVANSVLSKHWKNIEITWAELVEEFKNPLRTGESFAEYLSSSKSEKDAKKGAAGCFVGGELTEGRRIASAVKNRCLLTLDADNAKLDDWELATLCEGFTMAAYTTHSHSVKSPRLRWIIPLSRTVTPDEYVAISLKVAENLGFLNTLDPSTFQPSRAMFNPSCAQDGDYRFFVQDGPFLDPDDILSQYPDWRDTSYWPVSPHAGEARKREAKKQGDPRTKPGLVGAFCRCYDIDAAIEKYLSDVYTECVMQGRYTYAKGSTAAGLVVYDGGLFAYSNHATDPASGKLCNAFDLVRIHLYGEQDEDAAPDTPMSRRPSFLAMQELAAGDIEVKRLLNRERQERAQADFAAPLEPDADTDWLSKLEVDRKGNVLNTIDNAYIILQHDPMLKGCVAYNDLKVRPVALRDLPWRKVTDDINGSTWTDADDSSLRRYLEKYYKLSGKEKIMDGMITAAKANAIHPIKAYLAGLEWDNTPRLDTLLVDFLGAEDTPYTRAVTRKTFVAAVARVLDLGCKFDYVLTLSGPQGRGKSTLVAVMSKGWYTDSVAGIGTKEAYEGIQGFWLIELGELAALRKVEIEAIKNFISKRIDSFRAAYGRRVEDHPRQCVFIATTNSTSFLRDDTGNRRFWPVRLDAQPPVKTVWDDLTPDVVDQIWAEALFRYHEGEPLVLPHELDSYAAEQQRDFTEDDPRRGLIEDYLETLLPGEWANMDKGRRKAWFQESDEIRAVGQIQRGTVSAIEVWNECLGNDVTKMPRQERNEIMAILRQLDGWTEEKGRQRCGPYGLQNRFRRKPPLYQKAK